MLLMCSYQKKILMMLTGLSTCKTKRAPFPLDSHDGAFACATQNGTIVG